MYDGTLGSMWHKVVGGVENRQKKTLRLFLEGFEGSKPIKPIKTLKF